MDAVVQYKKNPQHKEEYKLEHLHGFGASAASKEIHACGNWRPTVTYSHVSVINILSMKGIEKLKRESLSCIPLGWSCSQSQLTALPEMVQSVDTQKSFI